MKCFVCVCVCQWKEIFYVLDMEGGGVWGGLIILGGGERERVRVKHSYCCENASDYPAFSRGVHSDL